MSQRSIAQELGVPKSTVARDDLCSSAPRGALHNPRSERQDYASKLNEQGKTQADWVQGLAA